MKRIIVCVTFFSMYSFIHPGETKFKQEIVIPKAPSAPTTIFTKTDKKLTTEVKQNGETKKQDETKGEKRKTPLHDVLIFLNHGLVAFSKNDNMTMQFVLALCQKAVPIIVSSNVVKNFFEHAKVDEDKDYLNKIIDTFKKTFNEWLVYKTENKDLYLLIPKNYLEKMRAEVDTESLEKAIKSKGYKLENVLCGFDIWHPTEVTIFGDIEPKEWLHLELDIENLKSLFVAKKDEAFGLWNMYVSGHGKLSKRLNDPKLSSSIVHQTNIVQESEFSDAEIAGMKLNQFRDLIQFFNDKINTNFLYYSSCYAGGFNKILPYAVNIMNAKGAVTGAKKPNFVVGVGSVSDSEVWFYSDMWKWCVSCLEKECDSKNKVDYGNFFALLHKYSNKEGVRSTIFNDQELQEILTPITPRVIGTMDPNGISGLPQVMFPGADIFTAVDLFGDVAIITHVMAKKHSFEKKPIVIDKNKKVILLSTDTVDELKLENDIPIISMLPTTALHRFRVIKSPAINLYNFMAKVIEQAGSYRSNDAFYIESLLLGNRKAPVSHLIFLSGAGSPFDPITKTFMYDQIMLGKLANVLLNYCMDHAIDYATFDTFFVFDKKFKDYLMYKFLQSSQSKIFFKDELESARNRHELPLEVLAMETQDDLKQPYDKVKMDTLELYLNRG